MAIFVTMTKIPKTTFNDNKNISAHTFASINGIITNEQSDLVRVLGTMTNDQNINFKDLKQC